MFKYLKSEIFIEIQKKTTRHRNDARIEWGKSGESYPKGMEVFQDQIIHVHLYPFMYVVHACAIGKYLYVSYMLCLVTGCGKGQYNNCFHSTGCCPRSRDLDLLFCILCFPSGQHISAQQMPVKGYMLQIKEERKKERNKCTLKVIFSMMGQIVISFVFSCAQVGGLLGRVGKVRRRFSTGWLVGLHLQELCLESHDLGFLMSPKDPYCSTWEARKRWVMHG